jgi:hypothetical protein
MAVAVENIGKVAIFAGAAPQRATVGARMRGRARSKGQLALFAKTTALVIAGFATLGALLVASTGVIWVSIQEKEPGGTQLRLAVPAILVPVGLKFVPRDVWREPAARAQQWMPVIKAVADELPQCPDATFVEVRSRSELVNIAKHGRSMVVDVEENAGDSVHVSFPVYLLGSVAHQLEMASAPHRLRIAN